MGGLIHNTQDYDNKIEDIPDLRPGANSQGIMGLPRI
jgi:hypothetical protein